MLLRTFGPIPLVCVFIPLAVSPVCAAAALTVQYPSQGAHLPYVASSFVFGGAPRGAAVTVNGHVALVSSNGAWIAYLPFAPGRFTLRVSARASGRSLWLDRIVEVAAAPATTPAAPARADPSSEPLPAEDLVIAPGEFVHLFVKASANCTVKAAIGATVTDVPLTESDAGKGAQSQKERALGALPAQADRVRGLYAGDVRVPAGARGVLGHVKYTISSADGSTSETFSKGSISVADASTLSVGRIVLPRENDPGVGRQPYGIVETSPQGGWLFFPLAGTPFAITGSSGDYYSVALGSMQQGWLAKAYLQMQPPGTPLPRAQLGEISIDDLRGATRITMHLSARVPFRIDEDPDAPGLRVRFYGAQAATNFIRYGGDRAPVRHVTWDQLPGEIASIDIALLQRSLWGYRCRWKGTDLELTVKKPPRLGASPKEALKGLLVVIDPGHSPDLGAVGPFGVAERDINLAISKRLAAHLQGMGARTVLTRYSNAAVGLYDRPAMAARLNADVLISVHNNALPDGVDPKSNHGYSVYYYQPQSLALARAIHEAYRRTSGLADYGLYYDNLALARPTEEPAVLTESAFMMWPPEEALLQSPSFQDRLGATIAGGLERWAEQMRALEMQSRPAFSGPRRAFPPEPRAGATTAAHMAKAGLL